jgi:AcrR family transcriptional regulator
MFARRGFTRTSLRLIAQRAQVSIALIGHHFGNKQALYVTVCAWVAQSLSEFASKELRPAMSMPEAGTLLVAGLQRAFEEDPDLATCTRRELQEVGHAGGHPSLIAALHDEIGRALAGRGHGEDANWWASQVLYLALGPLLLEPLLVNPSSRIVRSSRDGGRATDLLVTWRQRMGPMPGEPARQG